MVTICTTSLTFNNSTFCPHSVLMCFVWIWEQTAIISLYNINWLVFITETQCVYCAVRAGSLQIIHVELSFQIASAVLGDACRPHTAAHRLMAARTLNAAPYYFITSPLTVAVAYCSPWCQTATFHRSVFTTAPVAFSRFFPVPLLLVSQWRR